MFVIPLRGVISIVFMRSRANFFVSLLILIIVIIEGTQTKTSPYLNPEGVQAYSQGF